MIDVVKQSLLITGFVFVMMLVIEYVNIATRGQWQTRLLKSRWGQYLLAAFLGALPGCLGAFAVVAMFTHRTVTLGAVVAAMIATSGDEAFLMFALFPKDAAILTAILFALGVAAGRIVDLIADRKPAPQPSADCCETLELHDDETDCCYPRGRIWAQLKNCSPTRGLLAFAIVLFVTAIIVGRIDVHSHAPAIDHDAHELHSADMSDPSPNAGDSDSKHPLRVSDTVVETSVPALHQHSDDHRDGDEHHDGDEHQGHLQSDWNWMRITTVALSLLALFIVLTVSDHFLDTHLWAHVVRKHLPNVFVWIFAALVILWLVEGRLDVSEFLSGNVWMTLMIACLVGLFPGSGPHLIFVFLYAKHNLPFSILLANSIVQDGHGMLPILAHSRRGFIVVKAINLIVGLAIGALALAFGY
ncbi:MAG: putative manganese transporter [Planctomycetota bacterium]